VPAGPGDVHVHDLAVALDGHGDVVGKNAEQLLARRSAANWEFGGTPTEDPQVSCLRLAENPETA
jgi:hypothetical protein